MDRLQHVSMQKPIGFDFLKDDCSNYKEIVEFPKHASDHLSYEEFATKHLERNVPCLVENKGPWPCRRWILEDGSPNFSLIASEFSGVEVPVANCSNREFDSHTKEQWTVEKFCRYWMQLNNSAALDKVYYLKDWHIAETKKASDIYICPVFYQSDWLNEWCDAREGGQDYRFVYMGPKGTWTPLHHDVLKSYSWSANVCGAKRWLFVHPGDERFLKDERGELCFDVRTSFRDKRFPQAKLARIYEVVQNSGEIIFVPSGWHHQVHNEADTISVNHNWVNGFNIMHSWKHLVVTLDDVEREIEHLREMDEWHLQCQVILRSLSSVDFKEFTNFLFFIAIRRIALLSKLCLRCVVISFDDSIVDQVRKLTSLTIKPDAEHEGISSNSTKTSSIKLCVQAHNFDGNKQESENDRLPSSNPMCDCQRPIPANICTFCTDEPGRNHVLFDARRLVYCLQTMGNEPRYARLLNEEVIDNKLFNAIIDKLKSCIEQRSHGICEQLS